jgi:hypothetical protein
MIPDLAVIIESYIGFRMIEVLLMPSSRYTNQGCAIAAKVLAVLALIISSAVCLDILFSGTTVPTIH